MQAIDHTAILREKLRELEQKNAELQDENIKLKAQIDALQHCKVTGLEVVPDFEARCLREMDRVEKKRRRSLSEPGEHVPRRLGFETHCVAFIDLDGLKWINDQSGEGHEGGDKILRMVANSLKSMCRKDDLIVRRQAGGDEFLILLTGCSKSDGIRLLLLIREDFHHGILRRFPSLVGKVSFSFGVREVTLQHTEEEIGQMVTDADKSMHKWKERRKMERRVENFEGC